MLTDKQLKAQLTFKSIFLHLKTKNKAFHHLIPQRNKNSNS